LRIDAPKKCYLTPAGRICLALLPLPRQFSTDAWKETEGRKTLIAQLMFFALGFLVASLVALLIFPSFNARAKRLAKRRVEARLPISLKEVTVERDFLRAECALAENRKDRVLARKDEALHKRMVELGNSFTEIERLKGELADLNTRMREELHTANEQIATLTDNLRKAETQGNSGNQVMAEDNNHVSILEAELATLSQELATQRNVAKQQEERIVSLQEEALFSHSNDAISQRIEELADLIMTDAAKRSAKYGATDTVTEFKPENIAKSA